jgi:DNA-binding response OmpR family regulator
VTRGDRPARILVVDDDPTVAEVVQAYLRRFGMEPAYAADGPAALEAATTMPPDLVILDLMLPGIDGLEVCRRLRALYPLLPVIMLTALGEESDRVLGLEVGADDYVTKPFSPRELVLRVESVLRRVATVPVPAAASSVSSGSAVPSVPGAGPARDPAILRDGGLVLDATGHQATLDGNLLSLTGREFDLLAFLLANPGQAFTREQLMNRVWGWDFGDQSTVTVHVRRLREKVEADPSNPVRLATVWGVGYRWDPQAEGA